MRQETILAKHSCKQEPILLQEEEEEQLMEERKKRKDEKRKKEAAQKKTAEQKNKAAPELAKPSVSQPLPVAPTAASPSTVPCSSVGGSNNAKRALGNSQQQVQQQQQPPAQQPSLPRYTAREVPPRFRQQEQKQLLKRGQPLPGIAANLGSTSKPLNSQPGGNPVTGEQPAAAGEGQNSSRKQPDLDHSTLGSHYESSHWGTVSSSSDSSTNWDKVIVDGVGKEAWPSIASSDSEFASERLDADLALSSGSDRNLLIMASRGLGSEANGLRSGPQSKFVNGSNSNNMGKGSLSRSSWGSSWGGLQENGALVSTCPVSTDVSNGLTEIGNSRIDAWGTLGSSHGELNPSTLNSNGHRGAWPVLENSGHALKGPGGNSSCNPAVGPIANTQTANSAILGSSWGSLKENGDSQANGTRRALHGRQPQNPIPEADGPNNNTTNFVISSLPNPSSSMQMNELASNNNNNNTGTGTWGVGAKSSRPQASPILNGTSTPHLSGGDSETKTGGPAGTLWGGAYGPSYSGEACPNTSNQANSDTVNATLIMPPGLGGPSNSKADTASSHCSGWEEATKPNQSQGWGEAPKPNHPQGWGEAPKPPSSPDWNKPQDIGRWGKETAAAAVVGKPSGWLGASAPEEEPTGWEEPSPESIRRKIEIDDGTSAWGDPSKYNYKHVNMWNNNTLDSRASLSDQQAQRQQQGMTLPGAGTVAESSVGSSSSNVSGWGETAPLPATVDNGTSAWGKPVDTGTSWGESISDAVSTGSWGNASLGRQASNKPGILPDKWMEMEKHNLNVTEYSRVIGKGPHSRPQISKESSMDRNPYFDKDGLVAADDSQNVQFMSSQSTKFPPSNSALPNYALSSLTGLSAQSLNSVRQNGNPSTFGNLSAQSRNLLPSPAQQSLNSSQPNPRSQVPPPLPSPQSRSLSMQQQMMQQSCQLDPNLLIKQQQQQQQQQLHPSAMKSFLESVIPHANVELQKGPSQISAFSSFPIGSNSNLNVNMDMGSIKEPQSRLRKWTTVDSISTNTSSLDQNASKNEFRPGEPWKGYPNIDPETDPYITPGSVTNNLSVNTVREADHLRDRNSGSSSSLNTTLPSTSAWSSIRASNYNVSLSSTAQSTSSARNSDSKPTWSPASINNTSLAHELWKVPLPPKSIAAPSRPPPGLTGQKLPLSSWENSVRLGGGWSSSDARYTPGSNWSEGSSGRITNCLVLKNLTPQIDGSTLRTLCMQHGPLITFHLNLPHGNALVRYSSKEEVVKAQKSLHIFAQTLQYLRRRRWRQQRWDSQCVGLASQRAAKEKRGAPSPQKGDPAALWLSRLTSHRSAVAWQPGSAKQSSERPTDVKTNGGLQVKGKDKVLIAPLCSWGMKLKNGALRFVKLRAQL
ncbi:hypothetical protein JD844_019475 [Phrynosoma platyrhinos]|uniref:TNRC6 PABC binding domain-containing protein n=1 Tax=Phrynosoma platyrhinos TaxID=52577 RepID=A0ABQ7TPK6_PHRPL|nr:hypothetical protein JD844_019475 [Phrynosoma platyrhinos]